jgi:predicted nucleic acid-binding protein
MNKVVLDANIYVKLFKKEADSQQAMALIHKLVREGVTIIEPSVVVNETITTCEFNKQEIGEVCDFFRAMIDSNIRFVEIDSDLIKETLTITQQGHIKSGFPTFNDSLYQAIAIREDALFITADRRHYQKAKQHSNIAMLSDLSL